MVARSFEHVLILFTGAYHMKKPAVDANIKHYDYEKIKGIVDSLQYLKEEARHTGNEDIEVLIQSTFNILVTTYCMILRDSLPRTHLSLPQ